MDYLGAITEIENVRDYLLGIADGDTESAEAAFASDMEEALKVLKAVKSPTDTPALYSGFHVTPRRDEWVAEAQIELPSGDGLRVAINGPCEEKAAESLDKALASLRVVSGGECMDHMDHESL